MPSFFIPLKDLLSHELVPADLFRFEPLASVVDRLGITSYGVENDEEEEGVYFQAGLGLREPDDEGSQLTLTLPSFPDLALVLGSLGSIEVWFEEDPKVSLRVGAFSIRFPAGLLKPVRAAAGEGWESDPERQFVEALLSYETIGDELAPAARDFPFVLSFERDGGFKVEYPFGVNGSTPVRPTVSLNGPAMIGDSGFVIEVEDLSFDLNPDDPQIRFDSATLVPPREIAVPVFLPRLTIENAVLDRRGFSGSVSADWTLVYDEVNREFQYSHTSDGSEELERAELFNITGGARHIGVSFEQNVPVAIDVSGSLLVPYFDEPVKVKLAVAANGALAITLQGEDPAGISLSKDELLELTIRSLAVGRSPDGVVAVQISGALEPLLMSSDGLQWPRLEVTDLSIDSDGRFSIKEAWLDLKELATLDLWGFHFELRRIGIGAEERDGRARLWVDLSGGLRLIEQIPVALDVEGFRLTWPQDLLEDAPDQLNLEDIRDAVSQIEVEFGGIYLFFGVPDAVEFEGLIRFFKDAQTVGFAGDVALRVPASGFAAEAGLLVGLSFDPPFPFLYVYFGVELPAGIPLGQSGLALKGALGMFGLNVAPNKSPEQNWYYDWYKRGPVVGAHPTDKWKPEQNALALGVGVTITSADGYVKGTRGLIVLALPGPVLMIEGRALVLGGLQPGAEPPLRALAVFDGGAGTVQFNIEAEATLVADLIRAYGMLEAFFDFNDLTNWHLYLGQDTPRARRIRADILKLGGSFLFNADAYLMIDMVGAHTLRSRIGVSVGFEPNVPNIEPVEVEFAATLEGEGLMTARPEQFSGAVELSAHIRLSTFGFSLRLSADARFLTEGPKPLKVGAHVHIEAELPDPFDPLEATIEFEWESVVAPRVESPLSEIAVSSRLAPGGGGFSADAIETPRLIHNFASVVGDWESLAKASPVVPADSQPIVGFKQKMNSTIDSFARHPDGLAHHYDVGVFYFSPTITAVELYEHRKRDDDVWTGVESEDWELIASTVPSEEKPLPGVWLAESEPESPEAPSPRRVQLWTDNPLSSSARALGSGYAQFCGCVQPGEPLAARLLDDYPDLMRPPDTTVEPVCVDFEAARDVVIEPGDPWAYRDLLFETTSRTAAVRVERDGSSGAVSRAITRLLALVGAALRRLAAWLARLPFRPSSLAERIARVLRRIVEWIARLLSRGDSAEACLFVVGHLKILFPRRVKQVRIVLCRGKKISKEGGGITARRRSRSANELADPDDKADKTEAPDDPRACNVAVAADLRLSDEEWLVEATEGFDCLHVARADEFAIHEICYTTVEESERSQRAAEQHDDNLAWSFDGLRLSPGAYYRLDVITNVAGQLHLEALPSTLSRAIRTMLEQTYNDFVTRLSGGGNKDFHQTCFFQTEGPPTNLRPYVKWISPQHQAERFFYADNIAIRFLRSVRQMFGHPFELKVQIRDAQGRLVGGYRTEWMEARSATRFPEESVWEEHRKTLDWPYREAPMDDVLVASFLPLSDGDNKLLPRSRYQLEVVLDDKTDELSAYWYFVATYSDTDIRVTNPFYAQGAAAVVYYQVRVALGGFQGRLQGARFDLQGDRAETLRLAEQDRERNWPAAQTLSLPDPLNAVLLSSTFVTSGFESFQELGASYAGEAKSIAPREGYRSALQSVERIRHSAGLLARARWEWERAEVDYRFESLLDGRKGLEEARLRLREAEATHDASFRALAGSLADLYFQPVSDRLELYLLRDPSRKEIVGAWIRSPESLDVRLRVPADPNNQQDNRVEYVGRTEINLSRPTDPSSVNPIITIQNTDSTQLLVFPGSPGLLVPGLDDRGAGWQAGSYAFIFTYRRDYGDEAETMDHRYDRPVEHFGGNEGEQSFTLNWSLK